MEGNIDVRNINGIKVDKKKKRYLEITAGFATCGALLFGYDTGVINGSLPFMVRRDQLNLSSTMEGLVTSSLLLGAAFGAVIWGQLADRWGRKVILRVLAIIFLFATIGCSLAINAEMMIFFRVILGLSVGGASGIVPLYLGEISPSKVRGSMVSRNEVMVTMGQFIAYIANAVLGNLFHFPGIWRYMIALATIPAVVLWIGSYFIPETPRWLASMGRNKEALTVLQDTRDIPTAETDLATIQENIKKEEGVERATFKDFRIPWIRRILIIGILLEITQQFAGINIMMYYGTTILEKSGFGSGAALLANIGNGAFSVVGTTLYMVVLANRVKRRPAIITGFTLTTTMMLLITVLTQVLAHSPLLPYIVIICTMLFVLSFEMLCAPLGFLLVSEIFPLRVRGLGAGISTFFMWFTNFFVGLFFPILLAAIGMSNTFLIFVGLGIFCIVTNVIVAPETLGKTLEQLEEQFRNYKKVGVKKVTVQ